MKKIIFFDLDNTLHSTKNQSVPSETVKLLKHLASIPNVELGLATGRGPSKTHLLGDLINLFTYRIYINGAVAFHNNEVVYENPIENEEIENVLVLANKEKVSIGFVALDGEYITQENEDVNRGLKGFNQPFPPILEKPHLIKPIYQLWMFSKESEKINYIVKNTNLVSFPWHNGGADLVDKNTNKASAIKKVLENEKDYQLIAVGDGHNDIEMIELADIGIAMGNTGFNELKEKADYIAPHIDDNQLFEFFKNNNLI